MRKQYKFKKGSCGLCHPNKKGWERRWTPKEKSLAKEADKEINNPLSIYEEAADYFQGLIEKSESSEKIYCVCGKVYFCAYYDLQIFPNCYPEEYCRHFHLIP